MRVGQAFLSRLCVLLASASWAVLLLSCAGPSQQLPAVAPGQLFPGGYIVVRAPNSEGWLLEHSSPKGMGFAKHGKAAGENLGARLIMFELQLTETPEQLLALIKQAIENDTDRTRFEVLESSSSYTSERGYPCVRHYALVNDNQARTSPTTRERLLLEMHALYCRHPVRTNTGFAAIYSHRGRSKYPDLGTEAQDFMRGIQVPWTKPQAM